MSDTTNASSSSVNTAEHAVRRYLEFVADPSSAVDVGRITHLEGQLASSSDVIAKLKLHTELARAKEGDVSGLRSAFTQHAKAWAQRNDVGLEAFQALGVGDIALAEAGFDFGRGGSAKVRQAASKPKGTRAANVPSGLIHDNIVARTAPFTLAAVMAETGGSLGTVRKVIDQLEASGKVRNDGADKNHSGRGRAPHLFRLL